MSSEIVSLATVGILLLLLFTGMPLAFATGMTAVVLTLWLFEPETLYFIVSRIFTLMNNYALISVPLFVLMGCILEKAGVVERLFYALHIWSGRLRGGLAVGCLLAATILAAMVGVIGAEIVVLGMVCLPTMLARGYNKHLSVGVICAGGSLGTMLPPSIVLIVYGLVSQTSIGTLFVAAVLPGFLLVTLYLAYVLIRCYMNPSLGPLAPPEELELPIMEKLALGRALILPVGLILMVLGALYSGIATPTETAAIGVLGSLIVAGVNGKLNFDAVWDSLRRTGSTVAMLTWIFFGASALVSVYTLAGGTAFLQDLITGLPIPPLATIALMMLILMILGCFIDWIGIVLLTMPIFVPVIKALGFDPIWFGILFCMNMQISYLAPPFAPAAFYLKAVAPPNISLGDIFKGIAPFIGLQIIALLLVMFFPKIATWLPSFMG